MDRRGALPSGGQHLRRSHSGPQSHRHSSGLGSRFKSPRHYGSLRPPVYGPNQYLKLNVHVRDPKAWPEIEAKLRKLTDVPKAILKVSTSGDYKWVELAPVNTDAETFSRRIRFAKIVAVHNQQRLIYIDPGK